MIQDAADAAAVASVVVVALFCLFVMGALLIHEFRSRRSGRRSNVLYIEDHIRRVRARERQERRASR